MSRRDEENRRRRQKRLNKRQSPGDPQSEPGSGQEESETTPEKRKGIDRVLRTFRLMEKALRTAPPATRPGGCDPSLDRPDRIKYELATFATQTPPGDAKSRELEERLSKGALGGLLDLDHWAVEEFFWHGLPGDSWH